MCYFAKCPVFVAICSFLMRFCKVSIFGAISVCGHSFKNEKKFLSFSSKVQSSEEKRAKFLQNCSFEEKVNPLSVLVPTVGI